MHSNMHSKYQNMPLNSKQCIPQNYSCNYTAQQYHRPYTRDRRSIRSRRGCVVRSMEICYSDIHNILYTIIQFIVLSTEHVHSTTSPVEQRSLAKPYKLHPCSIY